MTIPRAILLKALEVASEVTIALKANAVRKKNFQPISIFSVTMFFYIRSIYAGGADSRTEMEADTKVFAIPVASLAR